MSTSSQAMVGLKFICQVKWPGNSGVVISSRQVITAMSRSARSGKITTFCWMSRKIGALGTPGASCVRTCPRSTGMRGPSCFCV